MASAVFSGVTNAICPHCASLGLCHLLSSCSEGLVQQADGYSRIAQIKWSVRSLGLGRILPLLEGHSTRTRTWLHSGR